ncbi:hypothetical protein, partial [Polyangium sp. 15x6]|uniref:hypothetical protein n=1 Tax=Polyangium sp. 15x6 TaxID=3042687 RepID=UPI00249C4AF2
THLQKVVSVLLKYRYTRQSKVIAIRAARVAQRVSAFVSQKEDEWQNLRNARQREGLPDTGHAFNASFRQQVESFIKEACAMAELPVDSDQCDTILAAALDPVSVEGTKGRFERIVTAMHQLRITPVKARTSQSLLSLLEGREQSSGLMRYPKEAELVHDYDPLFTVYLLEYLVRHAEKGMHGFFGDAFKELDHESRRVEVASWLRKIADELTAPRVAQSPSSSAS